MIARIWRGAVPEANADEYLSYLERTGVPDCRSTEGNRGVYVLRRTEEGRTDFLFLSLWDNWESITGFAGPEPEKAIYYPEDERFLLEMVPNVEHFEVCIGP